MNSDPFVSKLSEATLVSSDLFVSKLSETTIVSSTNYYPWKRRDIGRYVHDRAV